MVYTPNLAREIQIICAKGSTEDRKSHRKLGDYLVRKLEEKYEIEDNTQRLLKENESKLNLAKRIKENSFNTWIGENEYIRRKLITITSKATPDKVNQHDMNIDGVYSKLYLAKQYFKTSPNDSFEEGIIDYIDSEFLGKMQLRQMNKEEYLRLESMLFEEILNKLEQEHKENVRQRIAI